jgi:hypothetical protein
METCFTPRTNDTKERGSIDRLADRSPCRAIPNLSPGHQDNVSSHPVRPPGADTAVGAVQNTRLRSSSSPQPENIPRR